jgi:hypothetical protein
VFKNSNEFNVAPTKKEKMTTFTRETAEFENKEAKKKYIIANKQFEQQFYNLYMIRLTQMKDRVTRRVRINIAAFLTYVGCQGAWKRN